DTLRFSSGWSMSTTTVDFHYLTKMHAWRTRQKSDLSLTFMMRANIQTEHSMMIIRLLAFNVILPKIKKCHYLFNGNWLS
ncbi:MAG: hypothetical protein PHX62_07925, partial [Bacilli bacterium]|nr:hypothetical protein [Bacilli bacterium]